MSSLRTCPGCKWQFPRSYVKWNCKFCKTRFNDKFCSRCGVLTTEYYKNCSHCKECSKDIANEFDARHPGFNVQRSMTHNAKRKKAAEASMKQWVEDANVTFRPMTERDWLEACNYFGGCALCSNEHIETRQFIVPFKAGGRYSPWNMLPMCGKCSTYGRQVQNPFVWFDSRLGTTKIAKEHRTKVLEYFIMKVSEAIEQSNTSS